MSTSMSRFVRLLLVLVVSTAALLVTKPASAACEYGTDLHTTYWTGPDCVRNSSGWWICTDEARIIIGECHVYCNGTVDCWGDTTNYDYYTQEETRCGYQICDS